MSQLDSVQQELNEIKQVLNQILLKVNADTAVAAVRTERKLSEQKRKDQIKGIMVNNKHLFELAE
tara:strand:+ start:956 stop:1150 length:195 start_codon:yes stop_codon:yes gene_type:complete